MKSFLTNDEQLFEKKVLKKVVFSLAYTVLRGVDSESCFFLFFFAKKYFFLWKKVKKRWIFIQKNRYFFWAHACPLSQKNSYFFSAHACPLARRKATALSRPDHLLAPPPARRRRAATPAPPKNLTTPHLSRARPLSGVTEILGGCGGGRPAAFSGARTPGLALKNKLFFKQSRARFSLKFSLKNEQKAPVILLKK